MAGICKLPAELIEDIVVHLSEDKTSLRHCSLIGSFWTQPSYRHLFRTLTLSTLYGTSDDYIPRTLLSQQPLFLKYVHQLHIRTISLHPRIFSAILNLFPNLHSLVIQDLELHGWAPDEYFTSILEKTPTETIPLDLLVFRTGLPPEPHALCPVFDALSSIKELRFETDFYGGVSTLGMPDLCPSGHSLAVSSIYMGCYAVVGCMREIQLALDPRRLHSAFLAHWIHDLTDLSHIDQFLSSFAVGLEDVSVRFELPQYIFNFNGLAPQIDGYHKLDSIAACTHLRSLRFILTTSLHSYLYPSLWRKCLENLLHVTPHLHKLRLDLCDSYNPYQRLDWSLWKKALDRFEELGELEVGVPEEVIDEATQFIVGKVSGRAKRLLKVVKCSET
ncbi:hypothetical protein EW026_g7282 [Hermanssonia centrifuga]|uniref:F-box domain-containing protein n=1 Tax=Hermanssonia centrifuga TaxID=98765 RepID=A0A4S4K8C6_9APHY|nr:hypothetical protein EW026_g7282 [Hermanssonia centrifuga]